MIKYLKTIVVIMLITLNSACIHEEYRNEKYRNCEIVGQVFETTVNFNTENNFNVPIKFPSNVEVYESDAVLVHLLEEVVDGGVDVWTPLPQTYSINGLGTMIYSFNHSFLDLKIFLDGDFPLEESPPSFTQDQTFRITVIPSEFANDNVSMVLLEQCRSVEWIK